MRFINQSISRLIFAFSLIFLSACTPDNPRNNTDLVQENASTSVLVEFGTLKPTDSQKLMSATIYNATGAVLEGPATLSNSDFSFVSGYNCPNGAKNKASCAAIKLTFNPQGKVAGEYTATLDLGSISVPLHATVESVQEPTPEDIATGISSSLGDAIDFGSMLSTGNSVIKTLTLTNGNSVAINSAIDTSSLSPFILSYDACSNKSIAKGKKCQIKVSLSPAQLSGSQSGSLSYAGKEISFSAEVITPASVAQSGEPAVIGGVSYSPNLQFLINNSVVSTYEVPQGTVSLNIVVKNTGNLASAVSTASLSGSGLSIVSNGCSNRSLSPNQSCTVKVVVVGSSQHSSSSSLSYSGVSLDLTVPGSGGGGGGGGSENPPLSGLGLFSFETMQSQVPQNGVVIEPRSPLGNRYINPGTTITFRITAGSETIYTDSFIVPEISWTVVVRDKNNNIVPFTKDGNKGFFASTVVLPQGDYLDFTVNSSPSSGGNQSGGSSGSKIVYSNVIVNGNPVGNWIPNITLLTKINNIVKNTGNAPKCSENFMGKTMKLSQLSIANFNLTGFNVSEYKESVLSKIYINYFNVDWIDWNQALWGNPAEFWASADFAAKKQILLQDPRIATAVALGAFDWDSEYMMEAMDYQMAMSDFQWIHYPTINPLPYVNYNVMDNSLSDIEFGDYECFSFNIGFEAKDPFSLSQILIPIE